MNDGRLVVIPVLMESGGLTEFFTSDRVVDVTQDWYDFEPVDRVLPVHPLFVDRPSATGISPAR